MIIAPDPSATCHSRRSVLSGGAALALATAALRMRSVLAQDGTPIATPEEAPSWLFTQTFTGGDWEKTDDPTKFTLHLRGGLASTVGFTDRPNRDFTVMPTIDLLPQLWSDPTNPPNAAIIVEDAGTQYTFLLVLTDPAYDEATDTITYTVSVLDAYEGDGLGAAVERVADGTLPHTFGAGAIFIDSLSYCKPMAKACRRVLGDVGHYFTASGYLEASVQVTDTCYHFLWACNRPCSEESWNNWCVQNFPEYCAADGSVGCTFLTWEIDWQIAQDQFAAI